MARTISSMKRNELVEYYILRATLYRQSLPKIVFGLMNSTDVAARLVALKELGLLSRRNGGLEVTESGKARLWGLAGGRPPIIDLRDDVLRFSDDVDSYEIEAPEAREIVRRVSESG